MKRIVAIIVLMFAFSQQLFAVRAYPYPIVVTQPDGTKITIRIHGDENRSWKTTSDGRIVSQGADGFYRTTDSLPPQVSTVKGLNPEGGLIPLMISTKASVNVRTIVIPVQFPDRKFTVPAVRQAIYNLFNQQNYSENGATGSVRDYFRDNLGDYCNFTFDVCNPVTVPYGEAYYGGNAQGVTDCNIKQLVAHACAAADGQGVNFASYDFDRDGAVDNVFLIFAGHNEAEGGGDDCIWPQSWNVSEMAISFDGVRISNFSLYSEYSGAAGYNFAGVGSICHEYCHFLGLKDMYDVNDSVEGLSDGLCGTLSLMDCGNYNNDGRTPPYLNIFERQMLGLVTASQIGREGTVTVAPVQSSKRADFFSTSVSNERFYIEYRDGSKWDEYIGGTGLVVYHIDKSAGVAGSMSAKQRWVANAVNGCASHPCAYPVSASTGAFATSTDDAFFPGPGNVSGIHSLVNFPLMGWSNVGVGYGITGFIRGADGLECTVTLDNGWNMPYVTGFSVVPGQTEAHISWDSSSGKKVSGSWQIRWGAKNSLTPPEEVDAGSECSFTLTGLIPGEEYWCDIFFRYWDVTGKSTRIEFSSLKRLSDFPLIGGMDMDYRAGDVLHLTVLNLIEPGASVTWTIDGDSFSGDFFPCTPGSHKVTATVRYQDGSEEVLTKIFKVEDDK